MKNVNQPRKYSKIYWAKNGVIGQAAQVAVDRYVESLGATIRTGGSQDFVVCNAQERNTARMLRKASRIIAGKKEERQPGQPNSEV